MDKGEFKILVFKDLIFLLEIIGWLMLGIGFC